MKFQLVGQVGVDPTMPVAAVLQTAPFADSVLTHIKLEEHTKTPDDHSFGQARDSLMPIPLRSRSLFTSYKCVFCYARLRNGALSRN